MSVFVDRGETGRALPVPALTLDSDEDRRLDEHAVELARLRRRVPPMPDSLLALGGREG